MRSLSSILVIICCSLAQLTFAMTLEEYKEISECISDSAYKGKKYSPQDIEKMLGCFDLTFVAKALGLEEFVDSREDIAFRSYRLKNSIKEMVECFQEALDGNGYAPEHMYELLFPGPAITMMCYARGPDIENDEDEEKASVEYGNSGSPWLQVVPGANFSGYCKNQHCKAKCYVYMPVGKVEYLIRNGKYCHPSKCPQCKRDVEVLDWGFSHCCFKITAQKANGKKIDNPWKRADDRYYKLSSNELDQAEYKTVKILYMGPKEDFPDSEEL